MHCAKTNVAGRGTLGQEKEGARNQGHADRSRNDGRGAPKLHDV